MRSSSGVDPAAVARLNARIDRLPVWGLSPAVFGLFGVSYFFAFYDLSITGLTLPALIREFHLAPAHVNLLVSLNLVGYILGAYALGTVADTRGRRTALAITWAVLALSALCSALAWNASSLIVFRFFVGFGIGAQIALAAGLLGELSPAGRRGRHLSTSAIWGGVALAAAPFIALGLVGLPHLGWRILLGLGVLVAVPIAFLRDPWIPESPRWLVLRGETERAEAAVSRLETRARQAAGRELDPVLEVPPEPGAERFPTLELFRPPYVQRLAVVLAYWFLSYFHTYAVVAFQVVILEHFGLSLHNSLLLVGIGSMGFLVGYLLQPFVIDRVQRKHLMAVGLGLATLWAVLIGLTSANAAVVVVMGFFSNLGAAAVIVSGYAYTAEVFPTRARTSGMAVADGLGHLGGVAQSSVVIWALGAIGAAGTVYTLGASDFLALLIVLGVGVRTTGVPLTQLAEPEAGIASTAAKAEPGSR
jgi:putative MFS transporter